MFLNTEKKPCEQIAGIYMKKKILLEIQFVCHLLGPSDVIYLGWCSAEQTDYFEHCIFMWMWTF